MIMTNRTLSILAGVAAAMVVLCVILYSGGGPKADVASGGLLVQGLDPETIAEIAIANDTTSTTLRRQGDGFVLANKNDYPASTKEINDLLIECLELRVADTITESESNHAELGVADDSAEAVTVRLFDDGGKRIVGLIRGNSAERGSGYYIRLMDDPAVHVTEKYFSVSANATDYVEKELTDIGADDVASVSVAFDDAPTTAGPYSVVRSGEGDEEDISLTNIPEGMQAKKSDVEGVLGSLSAVRFSDFETLDGADIAWNATFVATLKSGVTYTVRSGKQGDDDYIRVTAAAEKTEQVSISLTESEEELKKKEAKLMATDTVNKFNALHSPWAYKVYSYTVGKFSKPLADLIEEIPADDTPTEIAASHILVGYQGSERSEQTRSKEEAKARAEEALAKVNADGADFAELAREYSDGPSAPKGGDLGTFGKGAMAPAFEEAAFALDVDATSDIVETPFGYHIIKRTE